MVDVNKVASFITSQIAYKTAYHNHKENMAWVATALYVPSIIVGSQACCKIHFHGCHWIITELIITVVMLLAACLIFKFVCTQFRLRWNAADDVEGLRRAHAYLCTVTKVSSAEWNEIKCSNQWPPLIQSRINERKNEEERTWKKFGTALVNLFRCKKIDERCKKVDERWKTELSSYLIMLLATAVAIVLVWVR
jgi:hypothetical protein